MTTLHSPSHPYTSGTDREQRYYSVAQAAELLGVSRVTIWRWMRSGRLHAVHFGHRTVRIYQEDVEQAQQRLIPGTMPSIDTVERRRPDIGIQDETGVQGSGDAADPASSAQHIVQFYELDASLLEAVQAYVTTGLRAGTVAVIIATEAHRTALEKRLEDDGLDLAIARGAGHYLSLDAEATLARFMVDGMPDRDKFMDVIGGVVRASTQNGLRLRAFGEMVALLALDGNSVAALRLEDLWNELQSQVAFSLYCAYPLDRLAGPAFAGVLEDVCATHGAVIPTEAYTALLTSNEQMRAITLLQEKARRLETEIAEREAAEQALREESEITETLARIGSSLTATLDVEELVQAVTDAATKVSGAAFGAFFHNAIDDHGETYQLYTISGASKEAFAHFPAPRNTSLFGPTFNAEGPIRIDDVTADDRYGHNPPYHGMPSGHLSVRSYLAVPVRSRSGAVLGGLFFGHPVPGVFSQRSERLVCGIAAWASIALDNASLYRDAKTAVHVRDEFLSAVSHDLRTPLTTIHGMTQVSRRRLQRLGTEPTEQISGALAHVEQAVRRMSTMIDGLLDLTRLESGRPLDLDCRPIDLVALIEQLAEEHQRGAPTHRVQIESDEPRLVGAWDAVRLERVVSNLLSNAIKYSPEGGPITISLSRKGYGSDGTAWACLSVQDEGIGIPAADLPVIFERFRRGSNVPRRISGAGIGLAGAKQIVEQHRGTIAAESQEGKGTRVSVRLPLGTTGNGEAG